MESGYHDMVCGHTVTVTDSWRAAPTGTQRPYGRAVAADN